MKFLHRKEAFFTKLQIQYLTKIPFFRMERFHNKKNVFYVFRLGVVWYQGIGKATVSGVFEDLEFKISEGSDQN